MWQTVRTVLAQALGDVGAAARTLALTDLCYKLLAFAVLAPLTSWLIYLFRAGTSDRIVADADIARFFFTTPAGIATLTLGTSMIVAITAIEIGCLMAVGFGHQNGVKLNGLTALRFGMDRALDILRLCGHVVSRALAALVPFVLAAGLVYLALLRDHDINYYLSLRPPEFEVALRFAAAIGLALALLLLWTIPRWAFALPLVLFENVHPRRALGESVRRSKGSRWTISAALAVWAGVTIALVVAASALLRGAGRYVAPLLAGSLGLLLLFLALFAVATAVVMLAIGVLNIGWFSMIVLRLYLRTGQPVPHATSVAPYASSSSLTLTPRRQAVVLAVILLAAVGVGLVSFLANRGQSAVVVIAHRGASGAAPENTLAAFRLAAEQGTDYVELDVQESADGEVLVVHDADLMKVGGDATRIWEGEAARLRSIDVGSRRGAQFASERVPTLAEALAVCRGRCRVIVELKSYGHNDRLEERVVQIVEEAGMADSCIFMSLDHTIVARMKELRPSWRAGVLVAKAMGDLTRLEADFLAVEARIASRRFLRRAHAAGKDVYIWTVNDPAWMLLALSRGVDGLITDHPALARQVIEQRAQMSGTQRFLVAQLIRMGASTETLERQGTLRP